MTPESPSELASERGVTELSGICRSIGDSLYLDYLANHKALVPEVASLLYGHWSDLFQAGCMGKQELTALLMERAVTHQLPFTLVALDKGALVGTGSIKLDESGTRPGLSPWVAGMCVETAYRRQGIGTLLMTALERKATKFRIPTLYLSVGTAEAFYERLGWTVMERADSRGVNDVAIMHKHLGLNPHATQTQK